MNKNILKAFSLVAVSILCCVSCGKDYKYVNKIEKQPKVTDVPVKDNTLLGVVEGDNTAGDNNFAWANGDSIAVFNLALGRKYKFSTSQSGANADFVSSYLLNNGDVIEAYFPYKSDINVSEFRKISMTNRFSQGTKTLKEGRLDGEIMFAKAIVGDKHSARRVFKLLTAVLEFSITNKSSDTNFIVDSLRLDISKPVFAQSANLDANGSIASFSETKFSYISIDFKGQTLAENEVLKGAIRLVPTTNGENSLVNGKETATLVLKTRTTDGEAKDFVIYNGNILGLPFSGFADSRGNFMSAEKYKMSYDITYQEIPAEGYRIDELDGKKYATIFNPAGLKALADQINANPNDETLKSCTISLYKKLTSKEFDMTSIEWAPIKEFNGIFNANGLVLKNLNIKKDGTKAAFITKSSATISNLTIKNATVEAADNAAVLANEVVGGAISNCVVEGSTVNGGTGDVAGFVGKVLGDAVIKDCHVSGTNIGASANVGGFASIVMENADIKGCYTDETVQIVVDNVKSAGGFINKYSSNKPLVACYSAATLFIQRGAGHIGGLIGQLTDNGKDITGCYSVATINLAGAVSGSAVGGLLGSRWINKEWNLYKGVYSNATINQDRVLNKVGNIQGKNNGPRDGLQTGQSVYYLQENSFPAVGEKSVTGTQKVTAVELKGKVDELNAFLTDSGYAFTVEGSTDKEPLKLKKVN